MLSPSPSPLLSFAFGIGTYLIAWHCPKLRYKVHKGKGVFGYYLCFPCIKDAQKSIGCRVQA